MISNGDLMIIIPENVHLHQNINPGKLNGIVVFMISIKRFALKNT